MLRPTQSARPRRVGAILGLGVGFVLLGLAVGLGLHLLLARPAPAIAGKASASDLDGEATWAEGQRAAPPITTLRDQSGRLFALSSLRGRTVVMTFMDSRCHAECPLAGSALASAEAAIPAAQRPVLVAVSVNPHDTPASARAAAKAWGLATMAPWHWLMGSRARLARVWAAYHIYVAPHPVNGDIQHTEALLVIDRGGYERSGYLYPFEPRFVTHDLSVLKVARG